MFVIFVLFVIFSLFTKQNSCHIERYKLIEFASKIIFIIFILPHLKIYFHIFLVIVIVIYIYIDRRSLVMLLYRLSAKTLTIIINYIK